MAIKLKVNAYSLKFKLIAFTLVLAGLSIILYSGFKFKDILLYTSPEVYFNEIYYNDRDGGVQAIIDLYYNDSIKITDNQKASYEKQINNGISKGYSYYVFDTNMEIIKSFNGISNVTFNDIVSNSLLISSHHLDDEEISIYAVVSDDYIKNLSTTLDLTTGKRGFYSIIISFALILSGLIWISIISGRKEKNGQLLLTFSQKIYNDILLCLFGITAALYLFSLYGVFCVAVERDIPINTQVIITFSIIGTILFALVSFWTISVISSHIKQRRLIKYTLIWKILSFILLTIKKIIIYIFKTIKKIWNFFTSPLQNLCNKTLKIKLIITGIILFFVLIINSIFIGIMCMNGFVFVFLWTPISIGTLIFLCVYFISKQLFDIQQIKFGAWSIRNGNIKYKIPSCKVVELNNLAQDINNIGEGLQAAVNNATISEKMKTELITNVSHDLKTPLTSIIGYIDLLSKEENLSTEARDYIDVINTKSQRLKNIISDLFDLSKGTSGNIEVTTEKIDIKKLIMQTIADMEDKIENSGQIIKQILPKNEVFINSDGKRLYRVFQNLIDNALKYSLPKTRIIVSLIDENDEATISIQNISSYEMEFTEYEILERFTRGDKSRASDGTGLGLSIAQTFTVLCGGSFNIKIDGDQFKVIIKFSQV